MADADNNPDLATRRARLAELDAALGRLRARYEVLTNAFKFDEAQALVAPIEAAERERAALAAGLPAETPAPAVPFTVARRRGRR